MSVWWNIFMRAGGHRGQKRASEPLELELWATVNSLTGALGTELDSLQEKRELEF